MAPVQKTEEQEDDASMRARLLDSLSNSFPGSALSKALHSMNPFDDPMDDMEGQDPLGKSCFAELRLEKQSIDEMMEDDELDECDDDLLEEDDELTSLSWLQDNNLLQNLNATPDALPPLDGDDLKENNGIKLENGVGNTLSHTHPPHVPYNPQKHVNSKPPYSFSCLIFMAIEDSPMKKLPVKDIYNWILSHFPYFQNAPTGWKNSVRHNLSLNKCFKKVEKGLGQGIGKGSLWCIDPDYRPNLLQALRKTPYHPYHQLQILANSQPTANYTVLPGVAKHLPLANSFNVNSPSPHLFPFLSRRLAQSQSLGFAAAKGDIASDIDVANSLLSLKALSRSRQESRDSDRSRSPSPPEFGSKREKELLRKKSRNGSQQKSRPKMPIVIYANPSEDHSYSATSIDISPDSPGASTDEGYDFEDCPSDMEADDDFSDEEADTDFGSDLEDQENAKLKIDLKRSSFSMPAVKRNHSPPAMKKSNSTPVKRKAEAMEEEDEELKIAEGADALLNLAGITTSTIVPLRSISPMANNNNNNNKVIKVEESCKG